MTMFKKSLFRASFIPMSLCSIEGEGADAGSSSASEGQGSGNAGESSELTTEQQLEKEFGQEITPATDDDSESSTGNEEDDADDDDGEDQDGEGGEDEEESEDDDAGEEEAAAPEQKSRAQKRIDELTAKQREAEREAAHWKRVAEGLGAPSEKAADEPVVPEEPDASKYQYGEHDLDYIKDLAKYEAKVEVLQEQAHANFKAEAASLEAKWSATQAKNVDKYPDYTEKVVQGAKDGKWLCSPVLAVGIKDSDYGVDISYELASNPTEAERISKLTPLEQAREFGRMEERHHSKAERAARRAAQSASQQPKPRIVSKAPTPPKRRVQGGGGKFQTAADTDDFAAFDRMADGILANQG